MRELALTGAIALAFGLGSFYATNEWSAFGLVNLALGGLAVGVGLASQLGRWRLAGSPAARRLLLPRLAAVAIALAGAVALERTMDSLGLRFDWTIDRRFELAPATLEALASCGGPVEATLFYDRGDPRIRSTRLLLEGIADAGDLRAHALDIDEATDSVERFEVASSNSVVLESAGRFEVVARPTEGGLWEGLLRLCTRELGGVVYVTRGEGEGDFTRSDAAGYTGLAVALQHEGYVVRDLVLAAVREVPADASLVLVVAPRRSLRDSALAALERFLERGGGLMVFVEPGTSSGIEDLLEDWGFELPDALVIDPASGPVEGAAPGVNPIAYAYADHAITRGLDGNAMTLFLGVRPVVAARKPRPEDRMQSLVYSSPRSWLTPPSAAIERGAAPVRPEGTLPSRHPLVAAGRYPRGDREARIVVFGDSAMASNQYLRALYNLDLVMNAAHWAAERELALTRRPKALTPRSEPLTPQQTLVMLYGVGLLLPELLLIGAAIAWLRRRSA